jgi:hypothetical protein
LVAGHFLQKSEVSFLGLERRVSGRGLGVLGWQGGYELQCFDADAGDLADEDCDGQ